MEQHYLASYQICQFVLVNVFHICPLVTAHHHCPKIGSQCLLNLGYLLRAHYCCFLASLTPDSKSQWVCLIVQTCTESRSMLLFPSFQRRKVSGLFNFCSWIYHLPPTTTSIMENSPNMGKRVQISAVTEIQKSP